MNLSYIAKGKENQKFWKFFDFLKNFLRLFNFLFLRLCMKDSNYLLCKRGLSYVHSRDYVYCFCQMFQGLRLFKGVRLFRTLQYLEWKKRLLDFWTIFGNFGHSPTDWEAGQSLIIKSRFAQLGWCPLLAVQAVLIIRNMFQDICEYCRLLFMSF